MLSLKKISHKNGKIKFIADSMLGNVARKLRLFGFDTIYYKNGDDEGLLKNFRERILLTCDRELYKRCVNEGRDAIFVERPEDEVYALSDIFKELSLKPKLRAVRCTVCNGKLRKMDEGEAKNSNDIPQKAKSRYKEFYVCTNCGKVYWFGSHWINITKFNKELNDALK